MKLVLCLIYILLMKHKIYLPTYVILDLYKRPIKWVDILIIIGFLKCNKNKLNSVEEKINNSEFKIVSIIIF